MPGMMLKRILAGALVSTTLATGALLMAASGAHAAPAVQMPTTTPPMRVSGADSPALDVGIAYWNRLAGHVVLTYVGTFDGGQVDARTVHEFVSPLANSKIVGLTQGNVGSGELLVTIDPSAAGSWVVWAHELGHTLGLGHHDEPGYRGVMRSVPQGYSVRSSDDKRLMAGR